MRKLLCILLLLSGACAHSQAVRWNWNANTINSSAPLPGALYPVLASTAAKIQVCTYSATQTCPSLVTTYTNAAESQTCPVTAQLTASQSAICTSTVDAQGTWGIWIAPGTYQYLVNTSYGTFGPYVFSTGGGGAGSGTVTNFTAGNLAPLFTTTVTNSTTTPNLAFNLSNAQSFGFYGNVAGSTGAPSFTTLLAGTNVTFTPTLGSPNTLTVSASGGGGTGCTPSASSGDYLFSTGGGCTGVNPIYHDNQPITNTDMFRVGGNGLLGIFESAASFAASTNNLTSTGYNTTITTDNNSSNTGGTTVEALTIHTSDSGTGAAFGSAGIRIVSTSSQSGDAAHTTEPIYTQVTTNSGSSTVATNFYGTNNGAGTPSQTFTFKAATTANGTTSGDWNASFYAEPPGGITDPKYCAFGAQSVGGLRSSNAIAQIACGTDHHTILAGPLTVQSLTISGGVQTPGTLYSAAGTPLPTCNSGTKGAQAVVSDATSPTFMGTYTSGGAVVAAVICGGSTWQTY